jgi:deoxyribonuclease-4
MTSQKRKSGNIRPPILGAHFSIAGGLHRALYTARRYGCNAVQIFTKNASTWKERNLSPEEIEQFKAAKSGTGIEQIAAHTSYLINIASPDPHIHDRSRRALAQELIRAAMLDIPYVVLHPGFHLGSGAAEALELAAATVNGLLSDWPGSDIRLLFENTAGQGTSIGCQMEHLAALIDRIRDGNRVGVCLDTAHLFAAGYDIRSRRAFARTLKRFNQTVGLQRLFLLHLNDSKKSLGSRIDRHEHIGLGCLGRETFRHVMNDPRLKTIPKIIETPKRDPGTDWDRLNLDCLRSLAGHSPGK